ncbi:hypothetical protein DH2020_002599 [Rehmannia glutinosa]|uniref:Glutathione S-transferase n=1 Tax=Rehmannia glutinosa TaxID=99300 RepID=A0ABR0XUI6_REHGL
MGEELKLFRTWSSRYALRVVHALKIKDLEYETIFEDIKNKSTSLLEYNSIHKKVPVLVHNGKPICESLVILEYIDEIWKQSPLLPQDPYEKAMARFWAKFGDDKKRSRGSYCSSSREPQVLRRAANGKKFFGGETIGYLDIAFGWVANLISILEEIADLKLVDAEIFPLLSAWMNNFSDHPVINECWPPRDKMVEKFKAMREPYVEKVA